MSLGTVITSEDVRVLEDAVREMVKTISGDPRHEFWPDNISYADSDVADLVSQH